MSGVSSRSLSGFDDLDFGSDPVDSLSPREFWPGSDESLWHISMDSPLSTASFNTAFSGEQSPTPLLSSHAPSSRLSAHLSSHNSISPHTPSSYTLSTYTPSSLTSSAHTPSSVQSPSSTHTVPSIHTPPHTSPQHSTLLHHSPSHHSPSHHSPSHHSPSHHSPSHHSPSHHTPSHHTSPHPTSSSHRSSYHPLSNQLYNNQTPSHHTTSAKSYPSESPSDCLPAPLPPLRQVQRKPASGASIHPQGSPQISKPHSFQPPFPAVEPREVHFTRSPVGTQSHGGQPPRTYPPQPPPPIYGLPGNPAREGSAPYGIAHNYGAIQDIRPHRPYHLETSLRSRPVLVLLGKGTRPYICNRGDILEHFPNVRQEPFGRTFRPHIGRRNMGPAHHAALEVIFKGLEHFRATGTPLYIFESARDLLHNNQNLSCYLRCFGLYLGVCEALDSEYGLGCSDAILQQIDEFAIDLMYSHDEGFFNLKTLRNFFVAYSRVFQPTTPQHLDTLRELYGMVPIELRSRLMVNLSTALQNMPRRSNIHVMFRTMRELSMA